MGLGWTDIAFVPDASVVAEAATAWKWLIPDPWTIVVCSMFGGLFIEKASGGVFWLESGTGELEHVAADTASFHAIVKGEQDETWWATIENWFLASLVEQLHEAGKRPGPGQCYGYRTLPVFEGGTYNVEDAFIISAREWLTFTASVHEQIKDIPDGGRVEMKVID